MITLEKYVTVFGLVLVGLALVHLIVAVIGRVVGG